MVSVEDLAQSCICVFISLFLSLFSLSLFFSQDLTM
jgi:hypothetical protein